METFLLSEPAIRPSRMSASVLRRKMTGMLSVRLDLVPEILLTLEPGFSTPRSRSVLRSGWRQQSYAIKN